MIVFNMTTGKYWLDTAANKSSFRERLWEFVDLAKREHKEGVRSVLSAQDLQQWQMWEN